MLISIQCPASNIKMCEMNCLEEQSMRSEGSGDFCHVMRKLSFIDCTRQLDLQPAVCSRTGGDEPWKTVLWWWLQSELELLLENNQRKEKLRILNEAWRSGKGQMQWKGLWRMGSMWSGENKGNKSMLMLFPHLKAQVILKLLKAEQEKILSMWNKGKNLCVQFISASQSICPKGQNACACQSNITE